MRRSRARRPSCRMLRSTPSSAACGRRVADRRAQVAASRSIPSGVTFEDEREAGPVHVGHQMWRLLQLDTILADAGLSRRAQLLTEVMTLNRLVRPAAEHAMPDWIRRTALADILGTDFTALSDEALYRNLDRLHPQRARIEQALAARERTLFNLDDTIYLYDLTSTYFEGQCRRNPQAKRGYSRDHRPDCKQVVIGLVLDRDGLPQGARSLRRQSARSDDRGGHAHAPGGTDGAPGRRDGRGRPRHGLRGEPGPDPGARSSLPRGRRATRNAAPTRTPSPTTRTGPTWSACPSPRNPGQKKTRVVIKRQTVGDEVHILCRSEARIDKDRAIRDTHEQRLLADLAQTPGAGRARPPARRPPRSRRRSAGSRSGTRGWRATTPSPTMRRRPR